MLGIQAARQSCKTRDVSSIGFLRSTQNIADGWTKTKMQKVYSISCEQETILSSAINGLSNCYTIYNSLTHERIIRIITTVSTININTCRNLKIATQNRRNDQIGGKMSKYFGTTGMATIVKRNIFR